MGSLKNLPHELRSIALELPAPDCRVVEQAADALTDRFESDVHLVRAMREIELAFGGDAHLTRCGACVHARTGVNGLYCDKLKRKVRDNDGCTWGNVM